MHVTFVNGREAVNRPCPGAGSHHPYPPAERLVAGANPRLQEKRSWIMRA